MLDPTLAKGAAAPPAQPTLLGFLMSQVEQATTPKPAEQNPLPPALAVAPVSFMHQGGFMLSRARRRQTNALAFIQANTPYCHPQRPTIVQQSSFHRS